MKGLVLATVLILSSTMATAQQQRPAVVELFTSQGCSSCPPADALLGELAGRSDVLALAYHVDYWDGIGWKDRFALPQSTDRQRSYQRRLGLSRLYTPQMVVDGRIDVVGSDRAGVLPLLGGRLGGTAVQLSIADGAVIADLPDGQGRGEAVLVALLGKAETAVGRGENAGQRLAEYNIVRAIRPLDAWSGKAARHAVKLTALPPDATAVAVLLQEPGQGPVMGAAMIQLPRANGG